MSTTPIDLGAGTGLLSEAVARRYPQAELVLVDGSREMQARARRAPAGRRHDRARPARTLPDGPFDAVVSSLAVHHLELARSGRAAARGRAERG